MRVYKLWCDHWNLVDRLNEDYHNHFQLRGGNSANAWALLSEAFYLMMAARAIWEENRLLHAYSRANRNSDVVEEKPSLSYPEFIVRVAEQMIEKIKSK